MKYNISVQTEKKEGFLYVKVCLWIFLLVRKQYLPQKRLFQPKNWGGKNFQTPFQAILRLKKRKNKTEKK